MSKLKKQHGFTLIEMLIVVAIIAILIAVSIPMVGNALENARESTDAANERAFKAALTMGQLNGTVELDTPYGYDAVAGTFQKGAVTGSPYGQGRARVGADTLNNHENCYLWGYIDKRDYAVMIGWAPDKTMNNLNRIEIGTLTGMYLQRGN